MKTMSVRIFALALALVLLFSVAGCAKKEADIDPKAVVQSLLTQVQYATELSAVGENAVLYFPDLPQGTTIELYTGSGYFADEVALLTLPKASDGSAAMEVVKKHLAELRNQFMNYVPEEVGKIDNAITRQVGPYLFLCITNDTKNANQVLEHMSEASNSKPATSESQPAPDVFSSPTQTSPDSAGNAPTLKSKSGTYHDYGTGAIRVDGTAFEQYTYVDAAAEVYAGLVNKVAQGLKGETKVYDLAIPTAIGVVLPDDIAEILPSNSNQAEAIETLFAKMSDDVITVNCFPNMMAHRNEYLYFHTDYHWNGRGAYYAYEALCKAMGVEPISLDERTEKKFDGFLGVLYWQNSGEDPILKENPDTVYAYYPKSENATMKYTDQDGNTYDWEIISDVSDWAASTKYSAFAGADNPYAVFTNPDVTDGSVCVVVKESYGNALLPYLVDHYSTIYEIDYRYWDGDLISFTKEKNADDLIFANNLTMIGSNFLIGKLANIIK